MTKKFITKKFRYKYGSFYDVNTNEQVKVDYMVLICADCYCYMTFYEGQCIRQSFVDENNIQVREY